MNMSVNTVQIVAGQFAGEFVLKDSLEAAKALVVEHYQAGGAAYVEHSSGMLAPITFLSYEPKDGTWTTSDSQPHH